MYTFCISDAPPLSNKSEDNKPIESDSGMP